MRKIAYKKYLAGALVFISVFMIFGASFAHAQDEFGPPPIDSPIVNNPSPTPVAPSPPSGPTSPGITSGGTTPASTANPSTVKSLNWIACGVNLFSCSIYGISYVVNLVANLLVSLGSILVILGLYLDGQVFSSTTVQAGFSVSLAIANLGFVLGIIVIALATILRNETYGIKQMLWKLIVMAILVNFGLVICGPIVGLSDSFTNYFLNASGGASGFANTLGQAFAPQKLFQAPAVSATQQSTPYQADCEPTNITNSMAGDYGYSPPSAECAALDAQIAKELANTDANGSGGFTQSVLSMIFSAAFLLITALTFITIGILLIVRYVYLAILLILLPLAWLMWIFPKFNHHFGEWWSMFIKWTFFPAISIFFVYLAFQSVQLVNGTATFPAANIFQASGSNTSAIAGFIIQVGGAGILQVGLDALLMCGLCLGGLYAANAMSIKGADTALHAASWAGGKVKGYAGRQGGKAARFVYQRGLKGDKINAAMQRSRIPLVSTLGSGFADLTEKGGKNQVANADNRLGLSSMSDDRLKNRTQGLGALDKDGQIAAVAEWQKRGKLDRIEKVGGMSLNDWFKKNKRTLEDYDQWKLASDIEKTFTSNISQRDAAKAQGAATVVDTHGIMGTAGKTVNAMDLSEESRKLATDVEEAIESVGPTTTIDHNGKLVQAKDLLQNAKDSAASANDAMHNVLVSDEENITGNGAGSMVKAGELMNKAAEKFWKGKDRGDVAKMRPDYVFGGEAKLGMDAHTVRALAKGITHGIATQTPSHLGSVIGKLDNKKKLTEFVEDFRGSVEKALASGNMTKQERNDLIARKGEVAEDLKFEGALYRAIGRKLVVGGSSGAGEHSGGGGAGAGGAGGGH